MTAKKPAKKAPKTALSGPTEEQIAKAKENRDAQVQQLLAIAKVYEETLEPKIVLLFRRMEEMIAAAQMPLVHINMVLDLLKHRLVAMADDGYVAKGGEKLLNIKGGKIG